MAAEIERKFLVIDDRWRQHASEGSVLQQAYLVATKGETVRIRTIDGCRATLTVKIRTGRNRREEYEYEIPYTDAKEMFEHARGVLQKTRFEVEHQGYVWEVDVYSGHHRGLVVAEVELDGGNDTPRCQIGLDLRLLEIHVIQTGFWQKESLFQRMRRRALGYLIVDALKCRTISSFPLTFPVVRRPTEAVAKFVLTLMQPFQFRGSLERFCQPAALH